MTIRSQHQQYLVKKAAGGSSPDPVIYCPANNYILDPGAPYVPPVTIPSIASDTILLLVDNGGQGFISIKVTLNSAAYIKLELLNTAMTVLDTKTTLYSGSAFNYTMPSGSVNYYFIRLTPVVSTNHITGFSLYNTVSGYTTDWNVYSAKFNTPSLTTLIQAFYGMKMFKNLEFESTIDNLTSLSYTFYDSGIEYYAFPENMPALTTMSYVLASTKMLKKAIFPATTYPELTVLTSAFSGSTVTSVDLSVLTLPKIQSFLNMCQNASYLRSLKFPSDISTATDLAAVAVSCLALEDVVMYTSPTPLVTRIDGIFQYCYALKSDINIPECTGIIGYTRLTFYGVQSKKITFNGQWGSVSTCNELSTIMTNALTEEFEFPRTMDYVITMTSPFQGASRIKKIRFPDSMAAIGAYNFGTFLISSSIQELTGDFYNPIGTIYLSLTVYPKLTVFNCPQLICATVYIGSSATPCNLLTSIEIYWESLNLTAVTLYAALDATELDRIMTRLPTVVSKTLKISGCPGYATCTKTIATAKGWTVT